MKRTPNPTMKLEMSCLSACRALISVESSFFLRWQSQSAAPRCCLRLQHALPIDSFLQPPTTENPSFVIKHGSPRSALLLICWLFFGRCLTSLCLTLGVPDAGLGAGDIDTVLIQTMINGVTAWGNFQAELRAQWSWVKRQPAETEFSEEVTAQRATAECPPKGK